MNNATETNASTPQFPINQWVDICSLDSAQLDAYKEANSPIRKFKMEWQHLKEAHGELLATYTKVS